MTWEVQILPPAEAFLEGLEDDEYAMLDAAIRMLEEQGPNLGEPFVKRITSSKHHNMKELRRQAKGKIFRVLFAFDSERRAILLVGGDKAEIGYDDFYTVNVPIADKLFQQHCDALDAEASSKSGKGKSKTKGRHKGKRR